MIQDAVNSAASGEQLGMDGRSPSISREEEHNGIDSWFGNKPPGLDEVDYEYLVKKRVFELPAQPHLDTLVRTYFEHLWPFAPIICRTDFIQRYRAATTVPFAPEDSISGLGFQDRSVAQTSFFTKSRLLYDFHCERDLLAMLQGSIVLSIIILDYPTDKDFQHWFYNSIRLFVKLDVPEICSRQEDPCKAQKLYRRIWWVLYDRDVFHSFVNTRNLRLLEVLPYIKPIDQSDWDNEDTSERNDLLEPISDRQKASLVAHCELAQIFSTHPLNTTSDVAGQDPLTFMLPLEEWRMSLADRMGIRNQSYDGEACYPEVMARSYLFECILCRHFRRRQEAKWGDWAKQRLRSAIFELDAIIDKVLASGTIKKFPMGFVATVPALLALHIEMALDLSETELARSMARVSINQTMLALGQMQHVPAIKRGLPAFESVLAKKDLYQVTGRSQAEKASPRIPTTGQHAPDDATHPSSVPQRGVSSADSGLVDYPSFPEDFLGYDFLDRWQLEQWEFIHI
uniref:Transcription factor domain-containing protein n=1 Tax=Bionectria ochroleuca TaxID=29856 RepID=A0A8H7NGJ1_BIOOC